MIRKILLGEKEMEFKASSATPILYKKVFKSDLLISFSSLSNTEDKVEQGAIILEIVSQLAYIMNKEATLSVNELFARLSFENYIEWLAVLEPKAIENVSAEIISLYKGNTSQTSTSKND